MRFVLYFFAFAFVFNTLNYAAEGDWEMTLTGAVISGLTIWWARASRDRRRRKLGLPTKQKTSSKFAAIQKSLLDNRRSSSLSTPTPSVQEESTISLAKLREEFQPITPENFQVEASQQDNSAEHAAETVPVGLEQTTECAEIRENSAQESLEPENPAKPSEVSEPAPERPVWRDAAGRPLHVGATVTFMANSKGNPVSINGLLLGERDGKALIEVQSGALLPKNDYVIPWNVVHLAN